MRRVIGMLGAAMLFAASPAQAEDSEVANDYPEASLYDASLDATAAVNSAIASAERRGTLVMIVMGANWCHDSRALAGHLESDRFAQLIGDWYEVVYVDVGRPQDGDGRNLDIAERFGVTGIEGTPTMLVVTSWGEVLNADTAKGWRNAASRSADEIHEELAAIPMSDWLD